MVADSMWVDNRVTKYGPEMSRLRNWKKKKGGTIKFKLLMIQMMSTYPALYSTQLSTMHRKSIMVVVIKEVSRQLNNNKICYNNL